MFLRGNKHLFWSHTRDNGARLQEDGHALRGCWNSHNVCVIWCTNASVHTETKKEFFSCYWTKLQNNAVLLGQDWKILRQVSPTQSHQSSGSRRRPVSTVRGLASHILDSQQNKISSVDVKPDSANVAVDHQTRRVGSLAQDTTCAETCA